MNYAQTLEYLFAALPAYHRIGQAALKPNLNNTIALLDSLDNPHQKFKSIHIAGTNGKGSTSHMLSAIFQSAGYKTGLYTSPHLLDFRERIRVNGVMIQEDAVCFWVESHKKLLEKIQPSFFEMTVAMAFDYFAKEKVDVAVIETGLGGRLDSTNVITPLLSVITNVSFDHTELLGDSLEKIAREKAGIIKQDVPVVVGEKNPATEFVFLETADQKNAPLVFASEMLQGFPVDQVRCDLKGDYQFKNILTVLSACSILKNQFQLTDEVIYSALHHVARLTGLRGRWEILTGNPLVIADVAHNEAGMRQILNQLSNHPSEKIHFVLGFVQEKSLDSIFNLLPPLAHYYFCSAKIPRALTPGELMTKAKDYGLDGNEFTSVHHAILAAMENAKRESGLVMITGSTFVVAEALVLF